MSDIAKFNSMISEEETKINNTYYQVGKLYVTMHSHNHEEEFAGMIATIEESEEKIRNYRQQIQDIKGVTLCTVWCGSSSWCCFLQFLRGTYAKSSACKHRRYGAMRKLWSYGQKRSSFLYLLW